MNENTVVIADDDQQARAGAFAERLFESLVLAMELLTVELGLRRGLYSGLVRLTAATADELAEACGIAPRYSREWLEQQAAAGIVDVVADGDSTTRRYGLSRAHEEVLLTPDSAVATGAVSSFLVGMANAFDAVVDDFGSGSGVPYSAFGSPVRHAIAALNRPAFASSLGEWFAAMPDLDTRLQAAPSVILDVGCGAGWSTMAIARRYPLAQVVGIDLDSASIGEARANLDGTEVADRVRFVSGDARNAELLTEVAPDGAAAVTVFEALHDISDPAGVLRAFADVLEPGGAVLVGDEKVADDFTVDGGFLERLNYGFSVLHCLPATIAEGDGEANGTVMRMPTMRRWAAEAGMVLETLDVDDELWRFYRLKAA